MISSLESYLWVNIANCLEQDDILSLTLVSKKLNKISKYITIYLSKNKITQLEKIKKLNLVLQKKNYVFSLKMLKQFYQDENLIIINYPKFIIKEKNNRLDSLSLSIECTNFENTVYFGAPPLNIQYLALLGHNFYEYINPEIKTMTDLEFAVRSNQLINRSRNKNANIFLTYSSYHTCNKYNLIKEMEIQKRQLKKDKKLKKENNKIYFKNIKYNKKINNRYNNKKYHKF